jgi:hypothetical protein
MRSFQLNDLLAITNPPASNNQDWMTGAEESVKFLQQNAVNEDIVIYASTSCVLIHGVLGLKRKLTQVSISELQDEVIPMPDDSWVIQQSWGGGKGHQMYLEPPLSSVSRILIGGEKIIFRRDFTGVSKAPAPIEISQKIIHSLDLYFVPERKAYCRLDNRGDIEDIIRIIHQDADNDLNTVDIVTIKRSELDKFMALSKTCLVLRFDFTRVNWNNFNDWREIAHYTKENNDLYYHGGSDGLCSFCNGVMVVRSQVTVNKLVRQWIDEEDRSKKKYASFKIYDRKNNINIETSCAPQFLSNYFQKSELPWEISPAFFRPEVLHRFKADPEKYSLEDRSISCRSAWFLKSYDINEGGQVHAYIGDLAKLPYEEQLYWQSFNEWPKGPISRRAFQTDIIGEFFLEHEPLSSLKSIILKLDAAPPLWWKKRGEQLADAVHYPATDSVKEWSDEILALDQFLVEGFLIKPLRNIANEQGCNIEEKWGSLRVLQEILSVNKKNKNNAKDLLLPLQRLHALRTEVKGHSATDKKREAELKARSDFGSLRKHFISIVSDCEKTLKIVVDALGIDIDR